MAKEAEYKVIAFDIKMEKEFAMKLDNLRKLSFIREHLSKRVGSIPIHIFFKKYEEPSLEEGFDEIYQVFPKLKVEGEEEMKFLKMYL